jgi:hypothetical protein
VTQGALAKRIVAATTATLIAGGAAVVVTAGVWGSTLREEARLLPGTVLAGVAVGGATHDDARDLATDALASALDRPVVLSHEDATWQVTPRDLGADTDLDERIATALAATVGAKRFEPTWSNPALDRWGRDMPARIGPGPDNPLGVRALNWNRPGGGDTLIRFHGTPNEASIGTASSNGCVRMFNADVTELYDLVPSGVTILSVA